MAEAPATPAPRSERGSVRTHGWRGALRRYGPWLAMLAIFAWIFESVSFAEAWNAAREADLLRFSAAVGAAVVWWFLLESRALAYLFTHLNTPVTWAEARSLRALTYLVTPINWNLGTAAIVLHLRQSKNVSALASSSTLLFYALIDLLVMSTLFASSIWLLPENPRFAAAASGLIAFLSVLVGILVLVMTDAGSATWLRKLRAVEFLQSWRRVRLPNIATLFSIRAAYFSGFVFLYWWGAAAFGVPVPLEFATAVMPLIQASATLPVTPGGLGTQQAVMLEFYEPFGPESAILAFGVAFPVAVIVGRMAIGLLYIRDLAEFRRVRAQAEQSEAASD